MELLWGLGTDQNCDLWLGLIAGEQAPRGQQDELLDPTKVSLICELGYKTPEGHRF